MKKISLHFAAICVFLCCSFAVPAFTKPYFAPEKISPTAIDKPFSEGSTEMRQEISAIIAVQKNFDKNELKKAMQEIHFKSEMMAQQVDENLNRTSYPKLYLLLDRVLETSGEVSDQAKNYWKMRRPYSVDKKIRALVEPSLTFAYPSGHTANAYVMAQILGELIPEKRQIFFNRAEEISQHRFLVGMHFQRDLSGGRKLAQLVGAELVKGRDFQKDFAAAQQEIK